MFLGRPGVISLIGLHLKKVTTMKQLFPLVLIASLIGNSLQAQPGPIYPSDLMYAVRVCSDTSFIGLDSTDFGQVEDLNSGNRGCMSSGEVQPTWTTFHIAVEGQVGFTIAPVPGAFIDIDFAVWGPFDTIPQLLETVPVRCSYAAPGPGAYITGLNSTSSDESEGAGGDGWVQDLDVLPGEYYVLLMRNYSFLMDSFQLSWQFEGGAALECLAAPVTDLTASSSLIHVGDTVSFTDLSTNSPYAWWWQFDGGIPASSTVQNPEGVTYAEPGCYDVTLTAYNSAGENSTTHVCEVQVESSTGLDALGAEHFKVIRNSGGLVIHSASSTPYDLRLLDAAGRTVEQLRTQGVHTLSVYGMPRGSYILVLEDGSVRKVHRVAIVD